MPVPRPVPMPVRISLPGGNYQDSCSSCYMNGTVVNCSCKNVDGYYRSASLETRYCDKDVSNDNGRLVCGYVAPRPAPMPTPMPVRISLPNGNYQDSCSGCYMNGTVVSCSCKDKRGSYNSTSLETRYCKNVSNDDGRLVCN